MLGALLIFVDLGSMAPIGLFLILFFIVLTVVATIASISFHKQIKIVARLYNGDKTKKKVERAAVKVKRLPAQERANQLPCPPVREYRRTRCSHHSC
jgi:hypothetical protein